MNLTAEQPLSSTEIEHLCQLGKKVIDIEKQAIADLINRIGPTYAQVCQLLIHCEGRVILTGMGKSGHIARKIAATLASTGTTSYFIHPAEASHGDLGMLARNDVIIAISNSGETDEILMLLPTIKLLDIPIVAMTGNLDSTLATQASFHIDISVEQEACPLGLAPTSSTTAALVMGDAIAITLLISKGFKPHDFARYHPAGALGRRLLLHVETLMHSREKLPIVNLSCPLADALLEITKKSLGMTTITDDSGKLCGIFTDGDLRRAIDHQVDIHQTPIATVMTKNCITIHKKMLATEALQLMEKHKITSLVVVENNHPIGVVHMHDLLRAGIG